MCACVRAHAGLPRKRVVASAELEKQLPLRERRDELLDFAARGLQLTPWRGGDDCCSQRCDEELRSDDALLTTSKIATPASRRWWWNECRAYDALRELYTLHNDADAVSQSPKSLFLSISKRSSFCCRSARC